MRLSFPLALGLAAALATATPGAAQDTRALAEQYVALPPMQQVLDQMLAPEVIRAQFLAMIPGISEMPGDKLDRLVAATSEAYNTRLDEITEIMIETNAAVFSAEELEAMIAFYSSEAGASAITKAPAVMQEVSTRLTQTIREVQVELAPQFEAIMKE